MSVFGNCQATKEIKCMKVLRFIFPLSLMLLSTACAASNEPQNIESSNSNLTLCPETRPQVCTREYNPVCATFENGSVKTYPTGCTACSNPGVAGYKAGAC
jgi:hypothetical protein